MDLDSMRALFLQKQKELSVCLARVEALIRQLRDLQNGASIPFVYNNSPTSFASLDLHSKSSLIIKNSQSSLPFYPNSKSVKDNNGATSTVPRPSHNSYTGVTSNGYLCPKDNVIPDKSKKVDINFLKSIEANCDDKDDSVNDSDYCSPQDVTDDGSLRFESKGFASKFDLKSVKIDGKPEKGWNSIKRRPVVANNDIEKLLDGFKNDQELKKSYSSKNHDEIGLKKSWSNQDVSKHSALKELTSSEDDLEYSDSTSEKYHRDAVIKQDSINHREISKVSSAELTSSEDDYPASDSHSKSKLHSNLFDKSLNSREQHSKRPPVREQTSSEEDFKTDQFNSSKKCQGNEIVFKKDLNNRELLMPPTPGLTSSEDLSSQEKQPVENTGNVVESFEDTRQIKNVRSGIQVPRTNRKTEKQTKSSLKKDSSCYGKDRESTGRKVSFDPVAVLLDAALEGDLDLIRETAAQLPDINAASEDGVTALHNTVCAGHFDIVEYLVENGCDVNSHDRDGWTPLHCAASSNDLTMAKYLVENGACIYAATLDEDIPLQKCEEGEAGYSECYKYLEDVTENLGIANNGKVFAVYDYEAQRPDEISFKSGDELTIIRRGDNIEKDWWWARLNDQEGYIPRNLLGMFPRAKVSENRNDKVK